MQKDRKRRSGVLVELPEDFYTEGTIVIRSRNKSGKLIEEKLDRSELADFWENSR